VGTVLTTLAAVSASGLAGAGAWLVYTGLYPSTHGRTRAPARRPKESASLRSRAGSPLAAATTAAGVAGGALAYLMFGAAVPALVAAGFAATLPIGAERRRRRLRLEAAAESWPRILEEIRLRTGSLGRSIPQALFEAGRSVPPEWRPAFEAAEREWLLTVDFPRTLDLLKQRLADPTADAVCETLLVAHDLGGGDLDAKLADLIEDRTQDVQSRRDAASRLAGVRFARRFVLLVPLGMAAAGLTIGSGRHAYTTTGGQLAVVAGVLAVAACWWWSGRLMRMPAPPRVFR
jgi:tight adherence protein B